MSQRSLSHVLDHVCRLAMPCELSDTELLGRFVARRDEAAFEVLLRRHGPLVFGLCRRLLHDSHVAEDVFQATFLVLARKAGSIRKQTSVASYLFGVAHRLALQERRRLLNRRQRESNAADLPDGLLEDQARFPERHAMPSDPVDVLQAAEVRAALDEELARLPDKYRAALLLCAVAGKSLADAAREVGCPEATLKSRLQRGRALLRRRLARRGIAITVGLTTGIAVVPAELLAATARAALPFCAGKALAGIGSAHAILLAEGLLRTAVVRNFLFGLAAALGLTLFGGGATWMGLRAGAEPPAPTVPPQGNAEAKPAIDRHGDPLPPGALVRLGTVRLHHGGMASFVAFLPNSKQLLSVAEDGTARLWDVGTGREVRRFGLTSPPGPESVTATLSADGRTLASCVGEETVRLWDVTTGKELARLQDTGKGATVLAFDRETRTLAVYGRNAALGLWDVKTGKRLRELRPGNDNAEPIVGSSDSVTFHPDGKTIAATHFEVIDNTPLRSVLRVWDTATGKERLRITGPEDLNGAFSPAFSPDGKLLGWAGADGGVRLVDLATGKVMREVQVEAGTLRFLFSPDSKTLIGHSDVTRKVTLWDVKSGKELRTFTTAGEASANREFAHDGVVRSMAVSPDGKFLSLVGEGCAVGLFDLQTGKSAPALVGHRSAVSALSYLAGGKTLVSRGNDGTIRRWETATSKETGAIEVPADALHYVLSPDAGALAVAGADNVLKLYDAATAKVRHTLTGGETGMPQFDFSPDGRRLAVCDTANWVMHVHDVDSGKRTITIPLSKDMGATQEGILWAGSATPFFAPGGKFVAACVPDPAVVVWEVETGHEMIRVPVGKDSWPTAGCFSPDARSLALEMGDETAALWELATGKERARCGVLPGKEKAPANTARSGGGAVAFSPDGRFLVRIAGSTVRFWDVLARKEVGKLAGHQGEVAALAFAPDGKTLATGALDGTALVWDAKSLTANRRQPGADPSPDALNAAWAALAGQDAGKAFQALQTLVEAPTKAVPFVQERLKPSAGPKDRESEACIAELDSDDFEVRERAVEALKKMGRGARPALRKALAAKPSAEVRGQLTSLLADLGTAGLGGDELLAWRAVEVLERIATPRAKALLKTLANGIPGLPATEAATEALRRLGK